MRIANLLASATTATYALAFYRDTTGSASNPGETIRCTSDLPLLYCKYDSSKGRFTMNAATSLEGSKIETITTIFVQCSAPLEVGQTLDGYLRVIPNFSRGVPGILAESNTLTIISLGVTPKLLKERKCLVDQLADVSRHLEELAKNVAYIERLVADGRPVPPERVQILKRTQIQLPMTEKKRDQLQKAIDEMDSKMANVNTSTLTANIIYPPTKVSIGALSSNCIEVRNHCRVYKNSQGELVFGSA